MWQNTARFIYIYLHLPQHIYLFFFSLLLHIYNQPPNAIYYKPKSPKFCFQFNRAGTHKTLDKDLAIALLRLCLTGSGRITHERLDSFCAYLEATTAETHSKITLDQWRSYLDFSYEYPNEETLGNYDEGESAWPVLIDEYCDYMSKMKTKK